MCGRWEVNATAIGEVTGTGQLRVFDGEALVGVLPVSALVDECLDEVPAGALIGAARAGVDG